MKKETGRRKFKALIKEIDLLLCGDRKDAMEHWDSACYMNNTEFLQVACLNSSAVEWMILSDRKKVLQSGFALEGIDIRSYAKIIAFAFLASINRGKIA